MTDHGMARYKRGCRCDECREANTTYNRDYKRRNPRPSRAKPKQRAHALRDKPLRFPNSPSSVTFDVPRKGKWLGSPVHFHGQNWLVVASYGGRTLTLRRFQDGVETDALAAECSRPGWWEN